jgi:zinc transport system substrate-binding protein
VVTDLEALDAEYRQMLTGCARTVFVTSHAAFGYLARRYGLEERAVSGLAPETEPDPGRIADLSDEIRRLGVPVVFAETLLPRKLAEALAREADVRVETLNPIEGLTDEEVAAGADYLSVMRDNLAKLSAALGCPSENEP